MTCRCGCGATEPAATMAGAPRCHGGDERVGDIARDAASLAVLERFGVNHCCGADLSLREGAAAAGVDLAQLLRALEAAAPRPVS